MLTAWLPLPQSKRFFSLGTTVHTLCIHCAYIAHTLRIHCAYIAHTLRIHHCAYIAPSLVHTLPIHCTYIFVDTWALLFVLGHVLDLALLLLNRGALILVGRLRHCSALLLVHGLALLLLKGNKSKLVIDTDVHHQRPLLIMFISMRPKAKDSGNYLS